VPLLYTHPLPPYQGLAARPQPAARAARAAALAARAPAAVAALAALGCAAEDAGRLPLAARAYRALLRLLPRARAGKEVGAGAEGVALARARAAAARGAARVGRRARAGGAGGEVFVERCGEGDAGCGAARASGAPEAVMRAVDEWCLNTGTPFGPECQQASPPSPNGSKGKPLRPSAPTSWTPLGARAPRVVSIPAEPPLFGRRRDPTEPRIS